jgi:hypothetical protein
MTIDPFVLFCAYHLGLLPDGTVRFCNGPMVARVLRIDVDSLDAQLAQTQLSAEDALARDYDMTGARMDIEQSPPGVDLVGIARMHYDAFRAAPLRDWRSALSADDDKKAVD